MTTGDAAPTPNPRARFLGPVRRTLIDAPDDLLTAGLGLEGLQGEPPLFADPLAPTPAELRRRAVYMNYRGLQTLTGESGYGRWWGLRAGQRVSGVEYLVALAGPDGSGRHTAWLQIPANFDPRQPCLVAAAASGSRAVYGALPIAGAWALSQGYALVSSDKGAGTAVYDVDSGTAVRIDGTLTQNLSDPWVSFAPAVLPGHVAPHTVLFRHAQSGNNPEHEWGDYLLQAIDAALQLLAQEYPPARAGHRFAPSQVRILATGISNGGATVLRALERDGERWIDGAVVSEPNVLIDGLTQGLEVVSEGRVLAAPGRSLYAYASEHFRWQSAAPLTRSAREYLLALGIRSEALELTAFNLAGHLWPGVAYSYTLAYARAGPAETPFGLRFAATDAMGTPRALQAGELSLLFTDGNGLAPAGAVHALAPLVAGTAPAVADAGSAFLSQCFHALAQPLSGTAANSLPAEVALQARVQAGLREATMTGRLDERPVLLYHGRADGLIAVNHASRAYYALALQQGATQLRYYEVQHAQHFDGYLALPGLASRYVPLTAQLEAGLSRLVARLDGGAALPPSQVLRSSPRGAALAPLEPAQIGVLREQPGADAVLFEGVRLSVPE